MSTVEKQQHFLTIENKDCVAGVRDREGSPPTARPPGAESPAPAACTLGPSSCTGRRGLPPDSCS